MEAKDLMIGDKLKTVFSQKIVEVKEIKQNCIYTEDNGYEYNEIEPIPLTPEILEKNGFVENRGITSWKFETDREDLIDIYGVNEYHLSINIEDTHGSGKGYRWLLTDFRIFYVHQLQHAMRLCGIEKEIVL